MFSQLQNLVIEPADLGLFHLHAAQFFAAVIADAANDLDHAAALFQAHGRDFLLRLVGGVDGFIDRREDAVLRRRLPLRAARAAAAAGRAGARPPPAQCRRSIDPDWQFLNWHLWLLQYCAIHFDGIDDAHDHRIDGRILGGRRQARGTSLREQNAFAFARAPTLSTATTELPETCSFPSLLMYGWISSSFIPRNFAIFCVDTTLPMTLAMNICVTSRAGAR